MDVLVIKKHIINIKEKKIITNFEKQVQIVLDKSNFKNVKLIDTDDIEGSFIIHISENKTSSKIKTFIHMNENINELEDDKLQEIIAKCLLQVLKIEYRYVYENNLFHINHIDGIDTTTKKGLQTLYLIYDFYEAIYKLIN